MNYLYIDASTLETCALLSFNGKLYNYTKDTNRNLGAEITSLCDTLINKSQASLDELDALAVGTGPGSLTGLRIAGSFLRTVSNVKKIPLVGVNLFEWAIESANENISEQKMRFIVPTLINKAFYYDYEKGIKENIEPKFSAMSEAIDSNSSVFGLKYSTDYLQELNLTDTAIDKVIQKKIIEKPDYNLEDLLKVLPMYIIPSQAERNFKDKKC